MDSQQAQKLYDSGKESVVTKLLEYDKKSTQLEAMLARLEKSLSTKSYELTLPEIPDEDMNPTVAALLDVIEAQQATMQKMYEGNQLAKDEIARLKKQNQKPKIKPKNRKKNNSTDKNGKRPGSKKISKTKDLEIDETKIIEPDVIPLDATFHSYRDFVVQDIILKKYNIKYRIKRYLAPDGSIIQGKVPAYLQGKHFGGDLICFCIYQHHHCGVTQPLLLEQLLEIGIQISSGHLSNILTENKKKYHEEKQRILNIGLKFSSYINVDDTGARHNGKNGYCTYLGNEEFSWFESTDSKSRINILTILRCEHTDYHINSQAIAYMGEGGLPKSKLEIMTASKGLLLIDDKSWFKFLEKNNIEKPRHVKIATEGALLGSIVTHGIYNRLVLLSDDARQFAILIHALCWIHAERLLAKLSPLTDEAKTDLKNVRSRIWDYYNKLKAYKDNPTPEAKAQLEAEFDEIFTTQTASPMVNDALKRLHKNKAELLLVLDRPEIPLHNNSAENAIREYVKKRKISGSTRSEKGRKCRDTFTTLKQTCRKQGITFWRFLNDRVFQLLSIPDLSVLIQQKFDDQIAEAENI